MYRLTEEGKLYLKDGLPEKRLLSLLPATIDEIGKKIGNPSIALSNAKRKGWIEMRGSDITLTGGGKAALVKRTEEEGLEKISKGGLVSETLLKELLRRKLVEELKEDVVKKAKEQLSEGAQALTPELIKSGLWKEAKLKGYDVSITRRFYGGRRHYLRELAEEVSEILVGMGFREMRGPLVESSFYNFDLLFMPQDHPGRETMDTFFLNNPKHSKTLPSIAMKTAEVHRNGGDTGSKGWGYEWSKEIAKQNVMRTHTTAVTFRYLAQGVEIPCKYFSVDRVFRNEAIDQTHLFEFHQIEGFVADDGLTLRDMMGLFKEFYSRFGIEKLKFKPVYNPYTEPSMEIYGFYQTLGKWVEMGNSGMFRHETLLPLGIKCPVIAWGLALERLAMLIHGTRDIRQVLGPHVDIQTLREAKIL